jgi:hypothetical protein
LLLVLEEQVALAGLIFLAVSLVTLAEIRQLPTTARILQQMEY